MRLVSAADLHLDATMVGNWDSDAGMHSTWVESFARLRDVVDTANNVDADILALAGDVFHNGRPTPHAVALATAELDRLDRAKVVMANGNHDQATVVGNHLTPLDAYMPSHRWCHAVASTSKLVDFDGLSLALVPWHRVAGTGNLEATSRLLQDDVLRLADQVAQRGAPALLFGHITVAEASFSSGMRSSELTMSASTFEATVPTSMLEEGPWALARLGHIHRRQTLSPTVGYLGSTYKVTFGEMHEEKGCEVIDITEAGTATSRFVPFKVRELVVAEIGEDRPLSEVTARALSPGDILRILIPADGEADDVTRALVADLRARGVQVAGRYLPRESANRVELQTSTTETHPVKVMEEYAEARFPDDPAQVQRVLAHFRGVYEAAVTH